MRAIPAGLVRGFRTLLPALIALGAVPAAADDGASPIFEEQRRVFRDVYAKAELGDWRPAARQASLLQRYVLWPDLRAAWLRTRVRNRDYSEVGDFLDSHGTLKPARELRYRYALALGADARHTAYLSLYRQFYQGLDIARLDCLALQAEIATGQARRIVTRGLEHWLIGRNQVDECDPVFSHLRKHGFLGEAQYRERFDLAIAERQFPIARYLARSLPPAYAATARQWSAAADNPADFLASHKTGNDGDVYRQQLAYAAEQLAYKNPAEAAELWTTVAARHAFSTERKNDTERHIALWSARRQEPGARLLLETLAAPAVDTEVLRWRARTALKEHDWPYVIDVIEAMPDDEQDAGEWRYWRAYAYRQTGRDSLAAPLIADLAGERSFYGFLSADIAGQEYAMMDEPLAADETLIADLQSRQSLIRARELFLVGLEGRGRSEWDATVAFLTAEQKSQASLLAHRWGWHSRAIATAAMVGEYDDLKLRFPLPYRQTFRKHASASRVRDSWVYGVARSESLFMRDIRSGAGAIGLMQLMPATGRRTAREINIPYSGHVTLTDPDSNIRLGTAYLRKMLERFDDNHVLATAAYNAGPAVVEEWLPKEGSVDSLIWIENIPYNETRKYVRRVLATDAIFQWRLTGNWRRISTQLPKIKAPGAPPRVADSK